MSRNSAGEYTLPVGNPVVTGTVIEASWANPTMSDLGNEITNSLDRTGKGGMLAALKLADGTELAPGATFNQELNSGFYRFEAGNIQCSVLGEKLFRLTARKGWLFRDDADSGNGEWWEILAANTVTIDENGNFTFAGDVIVDGNTNLNGDVFIDGVPISESTGGLPTATRHRYWRITVDEVQGGAGDGELRLNEFILSAGGIPLANAERYALGTDVTSLVTAISGNAVPSAGTREALINGVYDAFGASFANAVANGTTFVFDFNTNPQRITSVQQVQNVADEDWLSGYTLAYSDDAVSWTDAGTYTALPTTAPDIPSDPYILIEAVTTYANDEARTVPGVAMGDLENVDETGIDDGDVLAYDAASGDYLPTPQGGGGGDFWTFAQPSPLSQATVSGVYYTAIGLAQTFTLPASPSPGDRVGMRAVGVIATIDRNGSTIEGTALGPAAYEVGTITQPQRYVEFVYNLLSGGWTVFGGELTIDN